MLTLRHIALRLGGRPVLVDVTASLDGNATIGLVGPNGAGKTTLLRLMEGLLEPDGGTLTKPGRWLVGSVPQHAPGGEERAVDWILARDPARRAFRRHTAADPDLGTDGALAEAAWHDHLAATGGYADPARAHTILRGLGLTEGQIEGPCGALSGGQRMRIALASALFSQPDLLLLDEPTNHLDLETTTWLVDHLKSCAGALLVVSHDRQLLDHVAKGIWHLHDGRIDTYGGNYTTFERTRQMRLEHQRAMAAKIETRRKHMQAFVDRFRYKESKARQAQSRLKALAKLPSLAPAIDPTAMEITLPEPPELAPPLLTMDGVSVGYGGAAVLRGLSCRIDMGDRIGLLGANGNGKSTLARLLAGRLAPQCGEFRRHNRLEVAYFAQHQLDELPDRGTPLKIMRLAMADASEAAARRQLAGLGLDADRAATDLAKLSGGERARLLLALITKDRPQLLILDEPTNHLDIDARGALAHALIDFPGAVVLVSHDAHLLDLTVDRLWLLKDGACTPYTGTLADYQAAHRNRERPAPQGSAGRGGGQRPPPPLPPSAGKRARERAERQSGRIEAQLARLAEDRDMFQAALADPAVYTGSQERLKTLRQGLATAERAIAEAEEKWLALQEEIEGMARPPS